MAKFVTLNGSGLATGFYDSGVNAVPSGAVAITNAQYDQLISAPGTTTFIGGVIGTYTPAAFVPPPAVAAQLAIAAGLAITSTAHSVALNGTYALDTVTMSLAADLAAAINANSGAFPGSVSTWKWPDLSGTLHTFPSAAEFLAFQSALAAYRLGLYSVIWGVTNTLPTDAATIP